MVRETISYHVWYPVYLQEIYEKGFSDMDKKEYFYDAFISYRHTELDIFVAESLHKILERYRVPKRVQEISGKKKISRIFRDRDELPLSADLAENIKNALEQSEYLIVICSPEAVQSAWVQREIQVFLETHDKKNVLTILVRGEPSEAFPEVLCYDEKRIVTENGEDRIVREMVEPLAADVRAGSKEEVHKKLKQESLRILAPLLRCTYDDLRQRHKEYVMRRTLAAAGACTALALLFTIYALYQNAQIQKQYDQALLNESQYLIERSAQLLEEGDREGALQLALDAAPSEEMDRPLFPEVIYALNNALYSYQNEGRVYFRADKMVKTDSRTWDSGRFSENGVYYFNFDESGIAYVYESASGDEIWKFRPSELEGINDPIFIKGNFIGEDQLILVTENQLVIVDVTEQSVVKVIQTNMNMSLYDYIYTGDKYVLCENYNGIAVYDLESGESVYTENYENIGMKENIVGTADWHGSSVALGSVKRWETSEPQGLIILSADTKEIQRIAADEIADICFLDENTVATLEYTKEDYFSEEKWSYVRVYDLTTGQRIWSSEGVYSYMTAYRHGLQAFSMIPFGDEERHTILAANIDDTLLLIEPYQQNEFVRVHYASQIAGVGNYDATRLMVGLTDGSIWMQTMKNETFGNHSGKIENDVKQFAYHPLSQLAVQVVAGSNKTVFSRMNEDTSMDCVEDGKIGTFGYLTYEHADGSGVKAFRLMVSGKELENGETENRVILHDMDTQDVVTEWNIGDHFLRDINIFYKDGKPYFTFSSSGGYVENKEIHTIDLENEKEVYYCETSSDLGAGIQMSDKLVFAFRGPEVFHYSGSSFGMVNLFTGETLLPYESHLGSGYIYGVCPLADEQHVAVIFKSYDNDLISVKIWDMKSQTLVSSLLEGEDFSEINFDSHIAVGKKQPVLACYTNELVMVVDLLTGETLQEIPFHGESFCKMGFINGDKYLLLYGDSRELILWDMEKQQAAMSQEVYFDGNFDITTDAYGKYFGIKETNILNDAGVTYQPLHIFKVDEDAGTFYPYADVSKALACFEYEEIACIDLSDRYYYGKMKTLEELRRQAEEILE